VIGYWYDTTLEYKMEVMKMINKLNVNHKIGMILIKLNNDNPINEEIIRIINNNCNNVYGINVEDKNDSIDN